LTASDANPPGAAFPRVLSPDEHALLLALLRSDKQAAPLVRGLWDRKVQETKHRGRRTLAFLPPRAPLPDLRPEIVAYDNLDGDIRVDAIFTDSDGVVGNVILNLDPDRFDLRDLSFWKVDRSDIRQLPTADTIRFPSSVRSAEGYSDDYATCESCMASLLIHSEEIGEADITSILGFAPTEARAKGEPFSVRPGAAKAKWHVWIYRTTGLVPSFDIRRHVDHILEKLSARPQALHELRRHSGVRSRISCFWVSRYGDGGPVLSPRQMRTLADFDLPLSFDFYDHEVA